MTAALVQFLHSCFDEDERMARDTGVPLDWHQGPGDDPEWTDDGMILMWPPEFHTRYEQDKHWRGLPVDDGPGLAAHIARHDPARVLAEIDAKRRLVSLHEPLWETVEWPHDQNGKGEAQVCKSCGNRDIDSWQNWRPAVGEAGYLPPGVVPPYILAPCQTLRLLALPYAAHPDYRPEWAPAG